METIPEWCGVCKGSKPHYYCNKEARFICNECIHFCHKMAHSWKELDSEKEGSGPKSTVDKFNRRMHLSHP